MDKSGSKPRMMLKMCIKSCDILATHVSETAYAYGTAERLSEVSGPLHTRPCSRTCVYIPCWISMLGNNREIMLGQDLMKRRGNGKDTDMKV